MLLSRKLESIQYEAALAVSGAWKGRNTDRLLEQQGWETLSNRRWYHRLCLFYKIVNNQAPKYLSECVPSESRSAYQLRKTIVFRQDSCSAQRYSKSFFSYCVNIWNELDHQIRSCTKIFHFKTALLSTNRPSKNPLFRMTNSYHSKLITRLQVTFSELNEHRFRHNSLCESPLCNCSEEIETTVNFFLHCPFYLVHRSTLRSELSNILANDVRQLPDDHLCDLLLFGSPS